LFGSASAFDERKPQTVQVASLQEEHLSPAGCNKSHCTAHWTAMEKLRLHHAVNRKIKTLLLSETRSSNK
jgi:hypothetical protein